MMSKSGAALDEARVAAGLDVAELARAWGISRPTYYAWINAATLGDRALGLYGALARLLEQHRLPRREPVPKKERDQWLRRLLNH